MGGGGPKQKNKFGRGGAKILGGAYKAQCYVLRRKFNHNNQNKKSSDNSEVVWWPDVSDYSFEMTLWGVFMRLHNLKYQTTRQSEFSRSLSNYDTNEQLSKDP